MQKKKVIKRKFKWKTFFKFCLFVGILFLLFTYLWNLKTQNIFIEGNTFVKDNDIITTSGFKDYPYLFRLKTKDIENYIKDDLELGFTIIKTTNNYLIMCVVPTDRFYTFKHDLLKIDNNCFITTNDCYTVEGGSVNPLIDLTDL